MMIIVVLVINVFAENKIEKHINHSECLMCFLITIYLTFLNYYYNVLK